MTSICCTICCNFEIAKVYSFYLIFKIENKDDTCLKKKAGGDRSEAVSIIGKKPTLMFQLASHIQEAEVMPTNSTCNHQHDNRHKHSAAWT
jgi:hypothetical protein